MKLRNDTWGGNYICAMFILLPLVMLYLPAMYVTSSVPAYSVVMGAAYLFLLPFALSNIKYYMDYRFFRFLIYFCLWAIFSGLFLVLSGKFQPLYYFTGVFIYLIYNNVLWYLYPSCVFPRIFNLKTLIKACTVAIYLVSFWGLTNYTLNHLFNIDTSAIQDILVSRHLLGERHTRYPGERLSAVFEEPGYMGGFICVNLPIIYKMAETKFKIFKNKYLNKLFKTTFIPLIFITIIFVQSPIWIVFFFLTTFAYIAINRFKYFRNVKTIISTFVICLVLFSSSIIVLQNTKVDLSKTFLNRIRLVTSTFSNFEILIYTEQSLGMRLVSYHMRLLLFLQNPITGTGYKNSERCGLPVLKQLKYDANLPEMISVSDRALTKNDNYMVLNGAILWILLSDLGIIGTFFFFGMVILSILKINQIIKNLPPCLEKNFMEAVRLSYIAIICFSIYDIRLNLPYFWFLFGLTPVFTRYYNRRILDKEKKYVHN